MAKRTGFDRLVNLAALALLGLAALAAAWAAGGLGGGRPAARGAGPCALPGCGCRAAERAWLEANPGRLSGDVLDRARARGWVE